MEGRSDRPPPQRPEVVIKLVTYNKRPTLLAVGSVLRQYAEPGRTVDARARKEASALLDKMRNVEDQTAKLSSARLHTSGSGMLSIRRVS